MFKRLFCLIIISTLFSVYYLMTYPNLNKDAELLEKRRKDDEIIELKYKTEKHEYKNIIKCLKTDNDSYKKKYKQII